MHAALSPIPRNAVRPKVDSISLSLSLSLPPSESPLRNYGAFTVDGDVQSRQYSNYKVISKFIDIRGVTWWRSSKLESRGSIPDGVNGIFH